MASREDLPMMLGFIFGNEGGYVNDPTDPGGETKFGISKRSFPNVDIKNLTKEVASVLYVENYWAPLQAEKLPPMIAFNLLDCAINSGVSRAVKLAQKVLCIQQDGEMGPNTVTHLNTIDPMGFSVAYMEERMEFLTTLDGWGRFGKGWALRLARNVGFTLMLREVSDVKKT